MPEDAERPAGQRSTVVLFALGLVWLAAYLWAAHASIVGAGDDQVIAVFDAALALPGVVAATMLCGATASVTALGWLALRRPGASGWALTLVALVSGVVIGGLAAGMILLGYGHRSSIMVLAWAVLAAGAVGGILGSVRPREMVCAGLASTIVAFLAGFLLNFRQDALLRLFGAGPSAASRTAALQRLTLTESLAAGLLAGLVAFLYLRRSRSWLGFPAYLVAGSTPGVLLLLAEAVTRLGGAQLFGAAGSLSVIDQTAVAYSSGSRLNHGLIVLFVGAFVALIAFGATMRPATPAARPAAASAARRVAAPAADGAESTAGPEAGAGPETTAGPEAASDPEAAAGPESAAGPKSAAGLKSAAGAKAGAGRRTGGGARQAPSTAAEVSAGSGTATAEA